MRLSIDEDQQRRKSISSLSSPQLKATQAFSLKVLTYNTWGIPISPLAEERHEAIVAELFGGGESSYDIVAFQEVWHVRERTILMKGSC